MSYASEMIKLLSHIGKDIGLLTCAAVIYLLHYIYFEVLNIKNRTGFFCNDQDLMYPYKDSTVSTVMLTVGIGTILPLSIFVVVEFFKKSGKTVVHFYKLFIPIWIINTYNRMVEFIFGNQLQISLMILPKFFDVSIFLRPHFMAVCQPIMHDNTTCIDAINQNKFISTYECLGDGFSKFQIQNSYWTFPSGHASTAFYTAIYLTIYLQNHITNKNLQEVRYFLQYLLICGAIIVGITRIQDHHHYGIDVCAGSVLGAVIACINYWHGIKRLGIKENGKTLGYLRESEGNNMNMHQ